MADTKKIDLKTIKTKRPFKRVVPREGVNPIEFFSFNEPVYDPGVNRYLSVTQADFLEEYYPSGHKIYDETYFPDIWRTVDEPVIDGAGQPLVNENGVEETNSRTYCEKVPRYAFAFQQMIASAHITHATGNDIQHELAKTEPTEAEEKLFDDMCSEWIHADMERAWFQFYSSREVTADAAFVGQMDDKYNFSWRVFSYKSGDHIYPHYDRYGNLVYFARVTEQFDEDNQQVAETIEIWDDTHYYAYRKKVGDARSFFDKFKDHVGLENYELIEYTTHGFDFVPVAYTRDDDGPGWSASQEAIDCYELSFSQMAHNNQAYGEAILVLKSDSEIPAGITRDLSGSVKEIDLQGENDKAEYLKGQSASESYMKQLETLEDNIYRSSNAVKVPNELKNGDTPASAIKLLFANALNQAATDGMECEGAIHDMWRIFAYAYGMKNDCLIDSNALPVHSWVKPYIHLSESAITTDVVALKSANIISAQTAAERTSFYSKPGEARRIQKEQKAIQDAELLYEQQTLDAQADANIRTAEASSKLNNSGDGNGKHYWGRNANKGNE